MKKFKSLAVRLLLIISLFLISCDRNPAETDQENKQSEIETLKKEIALRLREYENHLKNRDSIALENMHTEDVVLLPSVSGRKNIMKVLGRMMRDSVTGSFETINLWGDDQLLVEEGKGAWYDKDGNVTATGKYLLVWKKNDGEWDILRDSWFPDKKE